MNRLGIALPLFALLLALPPAAMPSQQGVQATKNWKTMDQCAKEAQTAFPDYTAEANAKRETKLKECLEGKNLPPRGPLAPSQ
jgi:hypothetical protein